MYFTIHHLFNCMKGDTIRQIIEHFCLKIELERFEIKKDREDIIDKLIEALPHVDDWQTFVMILKNIAKFDEITLDSLIEKLESHELDLKRQNKMISSNYQQNVNRYYRGSMLNSQALKIGTAFSAENSGDSSKSRSQNYDSCYHSSSASDKSNPNLVQRNIALNLKDSPNMNVNSARQQMSFLASILESYESLVAGRIGNPNMTKEDYNQIDPEEMELINIRWCMVNVIRKAQRFMEITRRS